MDFPIAPDALLNMISLGCKADGCGVSCGCRKIGVHCSVLCTKCNGQTCKNAAPVPSLLDTEGETEELTPVSPGTDEHDDQRSPWKLTD